MAADDMLDDGQPQAGAALFPAAFDIDPIETFGEAGNGARRDTFAIVAHGYENLAIAQPQRDPDMAARPAIFDRIVDQVLEQLDQFIAFAHDRRQAGSAGDFDGNAV